MKPKDHKNRLGAGSLKKGLIIFISGMLISISSIAGNGEASTYTKAGEASKIIKDYVKFQNTDFNKFPQKVNVVFTVDENGRVNLVVANTDNQLLKKSIEEQFLTLQLKQLKANNAYSIQFNFKTL